MILQNPNGRLSIILTKYASAKNYLTKPQNACRNGSQQHHRQISFSERTSPSLKRYTLPIFCRNTIDPNRRVIAMDRKALRHLGFTYAGHLEIDQNDKIDATNWTDEAMAKVSGVYCWVCCGNLHTLEEVLYVGKYGKGLKKRFDEHRGGMRGGSKSGVKKAAILTDLLENQGHSVEIWHKRSNSFLQQYVNIFDKPQKESFSAVSLDEIGMIKHVSADQGDLPPLNGTKGG